MGFQLRLEHPLLGHLTCKKCGDACVWARKLVGLLSAKQQDERVFQEPKVSAEGLRGRSRSLRRVGKQEESGGW